MEIDWASLRAAAIETMRLAYTPISDFPVGVAGLVDDGRVIVGCNVENASIGMTLCAECGLISALYASGGGRLVAISCVDAAGAPLMPCGRCRQLLWEHGGPDLLVEAQPRPLRMSELLPHAFGYPDMDRVTGRVGGSADVPPELAKWRGRGTVFVHPDISGGETIWTGYWERSSGEPGSAEEKGILEEGPNLANTAAAVAWGLVRTPRIVVVDAEGNLSWAGEGEAPEGIPQRWEEGKS
ncbi:MAG TPA: cytidine deaminase [Actinoplanes sp.]|nr:cytidine deaminase [Actinoplanes sp.]